MFGDFCSIFCELRLTLAARYFVRVLGWARKYGLRVCLDFHALPGSQNGMSSYNNTPQGGDTDLKRNSLSFQSFRKVSLEPLDDIEDVLFILILKDRISQLARREHGSGKCGTGIILLAGPHRVHHPA